MRRQEQLDALNGADYGMAAFEAFDAAFAPPPGIDESMLELGAADSSGVLAAVNAPERMATRRNPRQFDTMEGGTDGVSEGDLALHSVSSTTRGIATILDTIQTLLDTD